MAPGMSGSAGIRLAAVSKSYGRTPVLSRLDLDIAGGEFVSILGPSGSGKTTILKIIAGFDGADSGGVYLDGRDMGAVPPERRNIGVVFQNYSLFPHMNVAANVGFPLRMRGVPKEARQQLIRKALAQVALAGYEERMPHELSGGQQQRVAIARATVFQPDVLLMDEPLGALDRRLRGDLQLEIRALHERLGITVVYVTHDQDEALSMSDRVVVINAGRIEQIGTPREVYRRPVTLFVADFLGDSLSISASVSAGTARLRGLDAEVPLRVDGERCFEGKAKLLWRSDQIALCASPEPTAAGISVPATVIGTAYSGGSVRLRVRLATGDLGVVLANEETRLEAGQSVFVRVDPLEAAVLAADEREQDERC
jgi:putative spermidine/putrescine transport system ATP-binding protein